MVKELIQNQGIKIPEKKLIRAFLLDNQLDP